MTSDRKWTPGHTPATIAEALDKAADSSASIFDIRPYIPGYEMAGPEWSLRQMVRKYYAYHRRDDPDADTEAYFAALAREQGA